MSTQRIYQLVVAVCVITVIAFVSERSRPLAAVVSVMPVNITIALWFVFTSVDGDPVPMANFSRMVVLGLIPTSLFAVACWFGFRQSWPLWRVLVVAYAVWLVTIGVYRLIDSWLTKG